MAEGGSARRGLDPAEGLVGIAPDELPPLPDAIIDDLEAGRCDPGAWFKHADRPLEIEIGPGKGSFLVHEATARPDTNFLAIEIDGEYYAHTADRVRRHRLPNVRVLHADASDFLRWRAPDNCASAIHLYFSDPWPKRKHHKNRVVQDRFLADAYRVLKPLARLSIVTDHDEHWQWIQEHAARWTSQSGGPVPVRGQMVRFIACPFQRPAWAGVDELVGTNYERKFCSGGQTAHAIALQRPEALPPQPQQPLDRQQHQGDRHQPGPQLALDIRP